VFLVGGVAAAILAAVEGGILPPGKERPVVRRSPNSRPLCGMRGLVPPGRMPGSTAGETPAATPLTTYDARATSQRSTDVPPEERADRDMAGAPV